MLFPADEQMLFLQRGVHPKQGLGKQSTSCLGVSRSEQSLTVQNFCPNGGSPLCFGMFKVPLPIAQRSKMRMMCG